MNHYYLKKLVRIANLLDTKGLTAKADKLDILIEKLAIGLFIGPINMENLYTFNNSEYANAVSELCALLACSKAGLSPQQKNFMIKHYSKLSNFIIGGAGIAGYVSNGATKAAIFYDGNQWLHNESLSDDALATVHDAFSKKLPKMDTLEIVKASLPCTPLKPEVILFNTSDPPEFETDEALIEEARKKRDGDESSTSVSPLLPPTSTPPTITSSTGQTYDFGAGPVPAHKHSYGGGWVADTASVADTAYVGINAVVYGNARVSDNAAVSGKALVYGNAEVYGRAQVYDDAHVSGSAKVFDTAWVHGNARVAGSAKVSGGAQVSGNAEVFDTAWVYGNAHVGGSAKVSGKAWVHGFVQVYENADISGHAVLQGLGIFKNRVTINKGVHDETSPFHTP